MKNSSNTSKIEVVESENDRSQRIKIYLTVAFIYIYFLTTIFL